MALPFGEVNSRPSTDRKSPGRERRVHVPSLGDSR